jgi:predicted PurR-regulated permease PerM
MIGAAAAMVRLFAASTRVLGWMVVAAIVASLLHPLVARLQRHVPRGLAVLLVLVGVAAFVGGIGYAGVDNVRHAADRLQKVAPEAAGKLEHSARFGDAARQFHLKEKVQDFVDHLPDRLRGGSTATALRSAATRGVAYLATSVLTLFLLVHGARLVQAALAQIHDDERRARVGWVLLGAYEKYVGYLAATVARAIVAGAFTWLVCREVGLQGGVLLGLVVGVASFVPTIGMIVGALPTLLLVTAIHPDRAFIAFVAFAAYQVAEAVFVQPRLDRATMQVGPVVAFVAMMLGLEAYGLGGMIVAFVVVTFATALLTEMAPDDDSDLIAAADELLAGDDA